MLVTEEPSRVPGVAGPMTTILFWSGGGERHRIRVFKPVREIGERDLPENWLRGALLDEGEGDCC